MWAHGKSSRCKNWFSVIGKHFTQFKIENFNNLDRPLHKQSFINGVEKATMNIYLADWLVTLNKVNGSAGLGRNKLRTYRTFKQVYETEGYCNLILPPSHRSALCKFRCGVAPIRIETGRYENLPLEDRKCPFCNVLEDEQHVLLDCVMYTDLRSELFVKAEEAKPDFAELVKNDQLSYLLTSPLIVRYCAKTCFNILKRRRFYLSK